jgi:hypothetical protein
MPWTWPTGVGQGFSLVNAMPRGAREMAGKGRLNKVIELLGRGEVVFSCGTIPNGNYDEIMALSQSSYDLIVLETEHVGFDFPTLRHSLQYLVNRKRIVAKGSLQPDVIPLVRIPPYTRERNEWVIKQTWLLLDSRVVDLPMAYNPTFVLLSSLKSLFFNGLKNE